MVAGVDTENVPQLQGSNAVPPGSGSYGEAAGKLAEPAKSRRTTCAILLLCSVLVLVAVALASVLLQQPSRADRLLGKHFGRLTVSNGTHHVTMNYTFTCRDISKDTSGSNADYDDYDDDGEENDEESEDEDDENLARTFECGFEQASCAQEWQAGLDGLHEVCDTAGDVENATISCEASDCATYRIHDAEHTPDVFRAALILYLDSYMRTDKDDGQTAVDVDKDMDQNHTIVCDSWWWQLASCTINFQVGFAVHVQEVEESGDFYAAPSNSTTGSASMQMTTTTTTTFGPRKLSSSPSIAGPLLEGGLQEALKQLFQGGLYLSLPGEVVTVRVSGWWGSGRASLRDLEVMMPGLPDMHVTGTVANHPSGGYTLRVAGDFSLGGRCSAAVMARATAKARARGLCFWFFCVINIDKNSRISLDFSPVLEIDISLRPTSDGKVDYAFTLGGLSLFGYRSDLGSEVVRVDFGVFNPIFGFIGGLFIRSQLEGLLQSFIDSVKSMVPTLAENAFKDVVVAALPKPGTLNVPDQCSSLLSLIESASPGNYPLIVAQLANIPFSELVDFASTLPVPAPSFSRLPCSGTGLMATPPCAVAQCAGAGGAGLEVYCYNSTRRYCRTGWLCPWRDITDAACAAGYGVAECSVSGLTDTSMADAQGTHRIRTDRRRSRRSWFFSRRRRRATYACAGPAAGKITCNIGAVGVENPAHTALWTLGQSGQSCTDACGGSCIETSWPRSEEEFKVSVGTITSECARISDGNGRVHPSMHQSDRRCWVNAEPSDVTPQCSASDSAVRRFCPCSK